MSDLTLPEARDAIASTLAELNDFDGNDPGGAELPDLFELLPALETVLKHLDSLLAEQGPTKEK